MYNFIFTFVQIIIIYCVHKYIFFTEISNNYHKLKITKHKYRKIDFCTYFIIAVNYLYFITTSYYITIKYVALYFCI